MWEHYKSRDNSLVTGNLINQKVIDISCVQFNLYFNCLDLFCGQIKSTLTCSRCNNRSITYDPFWDLSLSIPRVCFVLCSLIFILFVNCLLIFENFLCYNQIFSSKYVDSSVSLNDCLILFTKKEDLDGDEKPVSKHEKPVSKHEKPVSKHEYCQIFASSIFQVNCLLHNSQHSLFTSSLEMRKV